ncbi:MAG TPA: hypothetical protein VGS22_29105 [Thermoanaerobaculia bacterium]|nr:hypothetical protein [Thermoanaerobaculia bacterium]
MSLTRSARHSVSLRPSGRGAKGWETRWVNLIVWEPHHRGGRRIQAIASLTPPVRRRVLKLLALVRLRGVIPETLSSSTSSSV